MRHTRLALVPIAIFAWLAATAAAAEPAVWSDVPRVVALGDLHGSYDKLVRLLQGTGLVDSDLAWTGGEDHLVVAGDFLDRGDADRAVMDLLRRLEADSAAAGGRTHVLLGNHEVMNLLRDTRHVSAGAYRAFADEESQEDRRAGWSSYRAGNLGGGSASDQRVAFMRRFPRGYFARQRALEAEGVYGAWLLQLPTIVKINDVVYTHGGLTPEFAELGLDEINRRVRDRLRRHLEYRAILEDEGVITSVMTLAEITDAVERELKRPRVSTAARAAGELLLETAGAPILRGRGPLWYRGNSFEDERIEREELERSLDLLEARALVVAHSYTGGNKITSRFHGRLIRVDHGILESSRPLALVVERGEALVLDPTTKLRSRPIRELPSGSRYRFTAAEIGGRELEEFLREAEVVETRELGRGSTKPELVVLERSHALRRGLFKTVDTGRAPDNGIADRYQHEVAAYRLDKQIDLGLVPPTVVREIDERRGSLQTWVEGAVDGTAAEEHELSVRESAEARRRLADGRVFDALIGNHDRQPADILFLPASGQVLLVDHSRAFSTERELPRHASEPLVATPRLAARLKALDRRRLQATLGPLLSAEQLDALLARRDEILRRLDGELATASAPLAVIHDD